MMKPPGEKPEPRPSRCRLLLFGCFTLLLYLVATELLVRGFYKPAPKIDFAPFINPEWESRTVYLRDPELFWKFRPSINIPVLSQDYGSIEIRINNQGFAGEDWPRDVSIENHMRILMVGDSCVFGWGAGVEASLADQLKTLLADHPAIGRPVDIMAAGVPGYSSHQALILLRRWGPEYRPNWVVMYLGTNDALPAVLKDDFEMSRDSRPGFWRETVNRLALFGLLGDALDRWSNSAAEAEEALERAKKFPLDTPRRVPLSQFESNLSSMVDFSEELGARPLIVTRQNSHPNPVLDQYNETMRNLASNRGIPLVAAAEAFLEHASPEVFANVTIDPVHPNNRGYGIIAELVAEAIVRETSASTP